jgi:alkylation response protein AidB-like acyl-CoA dehydrogenase
MKLLLQIAKARKWNEEEQFVLDQVQRIADETIAPNAEHADETGAFPWKNIKAINELGLNGIFIPEAFGGAPMSYKLYLEVVSIISEACASTDIIYATTFHGMKPLIDYGTDGQRSRHEARVPPGNDATCLGVRCQSAPL